MARKQKPKIETDIEKSLKTAREAVKEAKERLAKADNETNKKALEHARAKLRDAILTANEDRWKRVGGNRVAKVIAAIKNLANAANSVNYKFTADHTVKMFSAIETELKTCKIRFETSLKTGDKEEKTKGFSFE